MGLCLDRFHNFRIECPLRVAEIKLLLKAFEISLFLRLAEDTQWATKSGSRFAIYASTVSTRARYVSLDSTQIVYVSTMFNRGGTFWPNSTNSTKIDRGKTFRLSSTEEFFSTEKKHQF